MFARLLEAGGSFPGTEDADKDKGRLPGEHTGNEIWIDQIYFMSVLKAVGHFLMVIHLKNTVRNDTPHRP